MNSNIQNFMVVLLPQLHNVLFPWIVSDFPHLAFFLLHCKLNIVLQLALLLGNHGLEIFIVHRSDTIVEVLVLYLHIFLLDALELFVRLGIL